jgi:hypothetical protein
MLVAAAPIAVDRMHAHPDTTQAPATEAEKAAAAFLQAFLAAEASRMKDSFADRVRIDGDRRFLRMASCSRS